MKAGKIKETFCSVSYVLVKLENKCGTIQTLYYFKSACHKTLIFEISRAMIFNVAEAKPVLCRINLLGRWAPIKSRANEKVLISASTYP